MWVGSYALCGLEVMLYVGWKLCFSVILTLRLEAKMAVLRAKILNIQIDCDVTQIRLVNSYRSFKGLYCLPLQKQGIKQESSKFTF